MQQATTSDMKLISLLFVWCNAQGHIRFQLFEEPFTQLSARHKGPVLAGKRRIIDTENHLERRFVHLDWRQGHRMLGVSDGVADMHILQTNYCAQIAGADLIGLHAAQSIEDVKLGNGIVDTAAICFEQGDALALLDLASEDAANSDATNVIAVIKRDDQHLQRCIQVYLRSRHMLQDGVEEWADVGALDVGIGRGDAVAARCVNGWEV